MITGALKDSDPAIRRHALEALAQGRDVRTRTLVEPLLGDADPQVRVAAANALSTLGARSSIPALRGVLGSGNTTNLAVADALYKLGDRQLVKPLKELMKKGDERTRQRVALILGDGDKDAHHLMEQRAGSVAAGTPLRVVLFSQLVHSDEKARDFLAEELQGRAIPVQILAAEALARLDDARGNKRLTELAQSDVLAARLRAFRTLADLGDLSGFEVFGSTFPDPTRPPSDRILAAQGLGACGEKSALEKLAPALDETDTALRLAAAGATLQILAADPQALAQSSLDWATAAINDSSWEVREQAAYVLAAAAAEVAVPLLAKALDDQKEEVRVQALRSMGKIGDKSVAPIITKHFAKATRSERVVAAGQLAKLGDTSHLNEVQSALKDTSFAVRLTAAVQLAEGGSRDGVNVLQDAVKRGGADGLRAWAALKKLDVDPATAVEPASLLESKDRDMRRNAVEIALGLPPAQAAAFFRRATADTDPGVRLHALEGADAALLKRALSDGDPAVRAKAAALLAKLLSPEESYAAGLPSRVKEK
jgi:HEAT repeat protein